MIRIPIWKFCYEVANLRRAFFPGKRTVHYFAFGANLDPECLKRRRIRALDKEVYCLRDYELKFNQHGPYEGMGFASVQPKAGAEVWGFIYEILETDAKRLFFSEMVPIFRRYEVIYKEHDAKQFFFFQSRAPVEDLKPSKHYLNMLLRGLKDEAKIPSTYVQALSETPVLQEFQAAKSARYFFKHPERFPTPLRILAERYEQACMLLLEASWKLNICNRLIRDYE